MGNREVSGVDTALKFFVISLERIILWPWLQGCYLIFKVRPWALLSKPGMPRQVYPGEVSLIAL